MAIFHSYVKLPERTHLEGPLDPSTVLLLQFLAALVVQKDVIAVSHLPRLVMMVVACNMYKKLKK